MDVIQVVALTPRRRDVYDVIWDAFTNVRIAIAIIVALVAAAFAGSLLIQPVQTVDPRLLSDPAQHAAFLDFARARYGFLAGFLAPPALRDATVLAMDALGLFDIFNAPWFKALLVVLAASVTMCTLNRLEPVWRTLRQPIVRRSERYYETARARRVVPAVGAERLRAVLSGYRIYERRDPDALYLLADRNAWARAGTLASHTALLILILSGAVGTLFGFRVDLAIANGSSLPVYPVGATSNVTVRNEGFAASFNPDGTPSDFYSDLVLVQNGREVARQRVRVNDPLRYGELSFHQSSFGPAADVEVRDAATGRVLLSEVVRFFEAVEGVPIDRRVIPGRNEELFLALPPRGTPFLAAQVLEGESLKGVAPVEPGQTQKVGDYLVTFRAPSEYTVIRATRNSGENLLWLASALFIGGVLATFWLPRRRLWIRAGERETILTGTADRTFDLESELDRLERGLR